MKLSVPKGESPLRAGVVPGSEASGKVVIGDDGTEVSQTAVSVLTNRNYILRPSGRMRYHILPKSNTSKEDSTEMVDVAGIDTSLHAAGRDIHLTEGGLEPYGLRIEKSAEVIVATG